MHEKKQPHWASSTEPDDERMQAVLDRELLLDLQKRVTDLEEEVRELHAAKFWDRFFSVR